MHLSQTRSDSDHLGVHLREGLFEAFEAPQLTPVVTESSASSSHQPSTSISRRQWSLAPHSLTEFRARTLTLSWKPRDAKT